MVFFLLGLHVLLVACRGFPTQWQTIAGTFGPGENSPCFFFSVSLDTGTAQQVGEVKGLSAASEIFTSAVALDGVLWVQFPYEYDSGSSVVDQDVLGAFSLTSGSLSPVSLNVSSWSLGENQAVTFGFSI